MTQLGVLNTLHRTFKDPSENNVFTLPIDGKQIASVRARGQLIRVHSGNAWITYNGEIYNYIELKEELKSKGHRFFTNTDTEVILAAYKEWQEGCLDKFNGMWAFVIYDKIKNNSSISTISLGHFDFKHVYKPMEIFESYHHQRSRYSKHSKHPHNRLFLLLMNQYRKKNFL